MNLTIEQCISIFNSLNTLKQENTLSFSLIWSFDDIINELKTHVERGEKERQKLIKMFGDEVKDKEDTYEIKETNKGQFLKELQKVFNYSVEVDIKKLTFDELQKEDLKVSKNVDTATLRLIIEN